MNDAHADSQRLDEVIAEYLHAEEAGAAPPAEGLLAAHPDLADGLREFLADRSHVHGLAGGRGEPPQRRFVPPKVRYFGDYELLDEIARGGMGVVYRARQTSLNRTVAIKMILSGHLASDEDVKRFQTEAEAAGNLRHPGIVAVHEVGLHDGHHYFSMDYIEGRSLAEIVRENPLPARKAAEYVQAIAEAVEYAHRQGTLHRDLKPSNVLIDAAGGVHVTDFGLAMRVEGESHLTRTGQVLGTPSYMPPEQAQSKRGLIGPASDVYALGVILYELLTGRPPFKGESSVQTLQQVIESEPVSLRLLNPEVPRDLETICLKCLHKQPHKRYPTAEELASDLSRWLNGETVQARPVGRLERCWRWCRRNPSAAGLLAAVLLLVMGAFSAALWFVNDRGNRRAEAIQIESERAGRLSRLEQGIEDAIHNAEGLRERSWDLADRTEEWGAMLSSARSAQQRAEALIDQDPDRIDRSLRRRVADLDRRLDADEKDQQFAARFEAIRMEMAALNVSTAMFSTHQACADTTAALASLGVRVGVTAVEEAAECILARPEAAVWNVMSALDLCLAQVSRGDRASISWLLDVQEAIDRSAWRNETRRALLGARVVSLQRLAAEAEVKDQPTILLISLAGDLFKYGFRDESLELLSRMVQVRPDDFWINHEIGYAWSSDRLNRPELSARYFQSAVALRPGSAGAWLNLGLTLSQTDDTDGAMAAVDRAIELEPDYAAAHNQLGVLHDRRGDYDLAIIEYRSAAELGHALAHANLGMVLRRSGDLPGAILAFQQAVDLEPGNENWTMALIQACLDAGELQQAIAGRQQWIELGTPSHQDYLELACLLRYTKNVDAYRELCRTMFDEFSGPDNVPGRHGMLQACLCFPEGEVTPKLLDVARQHGNSRIGIRRRMLGLACYRLGRDQEALEILEETADEDRTANSRLGSLLSLALVQLRLGQLDEARETIQAARTTAEDSTWDERPWSVGASLWREVQEALEVAGLEEPLPDLPPVYSEYGAGSAMSDRTGARR